MSDIRKLLDTINEMATTSGSVASVAQPMGGVKSRKKDSIFYEGEKCTSCGCEPCKCDSSEGNAVDGTKTPQSPNVSEFGLWKNSALIGQEQREKKKKKSVKESRKAVPYEGDREYNALDDVQDQIAKMAHRHKDEKWTMDDYRRLGKKLAQQSSKTKLDELGNSLMPGGQRSLHLAQETFVDPRNSRRHPGAVDENEQSLSPNKYIAKELDTLLALCQDQVDDIVNRSRNGYGNKKSEWIEDAIFEISGLSNGFHSSMEEGIAELQELNSGLPRIGKWIIGSLKNVGNKIDLPQLIQTETSNNQGVTETISPASRARNAAARDYETDLLNKDNEWKQTWLQKTIDFANKTGFQIKTNPSRTKAIFINKQLGFGLQAMVKNNRDDGLTIRYGDLDGKDNFNTDLAPDEFHDEFVRLYKDAKAGRVDQGHKFPTQNQFDPAEPEQKYLRSFLEQDDVEEGWKKK